MDVSALFMLFSYWPGFSYFFQISLTAPQRCDGGLAPLKLCSEDFLLFPPIAFKVTQQYIVSTLGKMEISAMVLSGNLCSGSDKLMAAESLWDFWEIFTMQVTSVLNALWSVIHSLSWECKQSV